MWTDIDKAYDHLGNLRISFAKDIVMETWMSIGGLLKYQDRFEIHDG